MKFDYSGGCWSTCLVLLFSMLLFAKKIEAVPLLRHLVAGLWTRRSGFASWSVHMVIFVHKVALGHVFYQSSLVFPYQHYSTVAVHTLFHVSDEKFARWWPSVQRHCLTPSTWTTVAVSLCYFFFTVVRSKLEYASVSWNTLTVTDASKFEHIQRTFLALCLVAMLWNVGLLQRD
jgi:hypothetical protein